MCGHGIGCDRAGPTALCRCLLLPFSFHLLYCGVSVSDFVPTPKVLNVAEMSWPVQQDIMNKRNPRLVPYNLLDERTKKTNRDSVCAAVRTLIGYGYNIEPPDQESSEWCFYLNLMGLHAFTVM